MLHDAHGFWIAEAGSPDVLPGLTGDERADVVVIGGGYTGMWTAWHVLAADPGARVVVLEAGRCGHGPSGRNGGFVSSLDLSLPSLRTEYG
jgi:glycine/D-amino acid oxidase-like deaminating enzyme